MIPESLFGLCDFFIGARSIFPFGGAPLHRGESVRPFFLVGCGRSGNTLLRRILQSHTDLYIPPETYVLGTLIRCFRQNRHMSWPALVDNTLAKLEFHPEFIRFDVSLRPLAIELHAVAPQKRSLCFILDSIFRHCAAAKETTFKRWGDKTPLNVYYVERIRRVFPDAQFVHLVRHGVDVVSSFLESGILTNVEAAAKRWSSSVRCGSRFARRHPEQCVTVKYEDLVTNPADTISMLCEFLRIDYQPMMIEALSHIGTMGDVLDLPHHVRVGQPIDTDSIARGYRCLAREDVDRLHHLLGEQLQELKYDLVAP